MRMPRTLPWRTRCSRVCGHSSGSTCWRLSTQDTASTPSCFRKSAQKIERKNHQVTKRRANRPLLLRGVFLADKHSILITIMWTPTNKMKKVNYLARSRRTSLMPTPRTSSKTQNTSTTTSARCSVSKRRTSFSSAVASAVVLQRTSPARIILVHFC